MFTEWACWLTYMLLWWLWKGLNEIMSAFTHSVTFASCYVYIQHPGTLHWDLWQHNVRSRSTSIYIENFTHLIQNNSKIGVISKCQKKFFPNNIFVAVMSLSHVRMFKLINCSNLSYKYMGVVWHRCGFESVWLPITYRLKTGVYENDGRPSR